MRTSGGRGADSWMVAIPIVALLIVAMMSAGGFGSMLTMLEGAIRTTITSVVDFVSALF